MSTIFTFLDDEPTIANLGAGGGVPSPIQIATMTLSDAQIKALNTPLTIIPAPGANRVNVLFRGFGILNTSAGAYTGADTGVNLQLLTGTTSDNVSNYIPFETSLEAATTTVFHFTPYIVNNVADVSIQDYNQSPSSEWVNRATQLSLSNAAPLGGGNAANTLKISLYYTIFSIT